MDGKRFKAALKAADIKQVKMADLLQVDPGTISRWASGNREPGDAEKVRIAEILGVSVDYLMGREEEPRPDQFNPHQRKHGIKDHTLPGSCTTGVCPDDPLADIPDEVYEDAHALRLRFVLAYDYSSLSEDDSLMHPNGSCSIPEDQLRDDLKRADIYAIRPDIPFNLSTTKPIPNDFLLIANRKFTFKSGGLYVVALRGRCLVRRVMDYADGSVELLTSDNTTYLSPEEQQKAGYRLLAKIELAYPSVEPIDLS